MKFTRDKDTRYEWVSECGNYQIWIQSRVRHEPAYWAASFRHETPWLTNNDTKVGAKRSCEEHAARARVKVISPRKSKKTKEPGPSWLDGWSAVIKELGKK